MWNSVGGDFCFYYKKLSSLILATEQQSKSKSDLLLSQGGRTLSLFFQLASWIGLGLTKYGKV